MKKLVFSLAIIAMFISSCNNDEIDELNNRIDKLEQKIPTIDEQTASISQSVISLKNIVVELEKLIATLEKNEKSTTEELDLLKQKNIELNQKIAELEDYVNKKYDSVKDWVSVTFATLEQYNSVIADIASIKNSISNFDSEVKNTITVAILDVESSMKTWVGDLLSNYYSIAEVDAKIAAIERSQANNDDAIEDINDEVEDLKTSLKKAKEELTTAYKSAIEDAIVSNNGVINNRIANEIKTINSRIDNEIAAINNRLNDIEKRLDTLEDKVDDLYDRELNIEFDNLENIGIVAGGTCKVNYTITKSASTVHIATIAQNGWRANVTKTSENEGYITVYAPNPLTTDPVIVLVSDANTTIMRSLSFVEGVTTITTKAYAITSEATTLNIDVQTNLNYTVNIPTEANSWISLQDITTRSTMRNDVIKLNIEGNTSKSSRSATLQLVCDDTEVGTISIYQQGIEIANNELVYTSSNGEIITPYQTTGFSANIISNTYSNGKGVIVFDKDITAISEYAFYNCSKLTSIKIPNSITKIRDYAFYNSAITNMEISENVTEIGDYTFSKCKNLTSVNIPDAVTSIGLSAFSYCENLTSINIPDAVTSIGDYAFSNCGLRNITIPDKVTIIREGVLNNCDNLTSITIGNRVAEIEDNAFQSCDNLTTLYCKSITPPSLGIGAFRNTYPRIYVPSQSVARYENTSRWNELTIVGYDF